MSNSQSLDEEVKERVAEKQKNKEFKDLGEKF